MNARRKVACTVAICLATCTAVCRHSSVSAPAARDVAALIEKGDYVAAESAAVANLDSVRRTSGDRSLAFASAADLLVRALLANGRAASGEALALANQTLRIREAALGSTHPDLAPSLQGLGEVLGERQENDAAVEALERALGLQTNRPTSEPDVSVACTLDQLALSLSRAGRFEEAVKAANHGLQVRERLADTQGTARSLEVLVRVLQEKGDSPAAGAPLSRALELRRSQAPSHPDYIETLSLQSYQEWSRGRFHEAREAASAALALAERTLRPDHPRVAQAMSLLAGARLDLWDIEGAHDLMRRAVAVAERSLGSEHPDYARHLNDLANVTVLLGDYQAARSLYERGLAILEARFGEAHDMVATAAYNLARVNRVLGDYDRALRDYRRATAIWEQVFSPNHAFVAQALAAQAVVVREQGDLKSALALQERALAIRERVLEPQHPTIARTLTAIAETYQQLGRIVEAERSSDRAIRIWTAAGSPNAHDYAAALALSAGLSFERGSIRQARKGFERALAVDLGIFGSAHPDVAQARMSLARAMARTGEAAMALEGAIEAEAVGREHLRMMLRSLPERQALNYAGIRPRGVDLMLSLVGLTPQAAAAGADAVVRSRALVLDEVAGRQRTAAGADRTLAAGLATARQRLANLVVQGPGAMPRERFDALVDAARRDSEVAERRLAEGSDDFRLERDRAHIGLSEVAAALPPGTTLVSYVRYQQLRLDARRADETPSFMAFVLRPGKTPVAVKLGPAQAIESLVSRWRAGIAADVLGQTASAAARRGVLRRCGVCPSRTDLGSHRSHLVGARAIVLVPDGALSLVPFAALPAAGGYLIESAPPIHYLTAERDLVAIAAAPETSAGGMLALGGPAFDDVTMPGDLTSAPLATTGLRGAVSTTAERRRAAGTLDVAASPCGNLQSIRFQPLDGTLQEVRELAALWPGTLGPPDTRVGRQADEQTFKRDAHRYRVLHLATHGFFLDASCGPAAPRDSRRRRPCPAATAPPRTRCSCRASPLPVPTGERLLARTRTKAFSPPKRSRSLDLHGVEWAVLSACDTGVGEIKAGEGVFGLRRAFQVAGARTVVMSLWSVEDQATRAWMRALYEGRFQRKLSTADAVHQASLAVLRDRRAKGQSTHPFFWAAFVAAGDWR